MIIHSLKSYWKYFLYILEHKKNVFIECWKEGLYIHAFTHDLSKFHPKEFFAYAQHFHFGLCNAQKINWNMNEKFDAAWEHHKLHNKHHWDYWHINGKDMPVKYIKQMICDWKAMGKKFGDTAQEYYLKNYLKIQLDNESRRILEVQLDLCLKGVCQSDWGYWMTIEEIIKDCLNTENLNLSFFNNYLDEFKRKYNVDMLEVLGLENKNMEE